MKITKEKTKKERIRIRKLCTLAMLTAITVLLSIFATFRVGNQIKIPLKFITVFMTGAIYGPLAAGIVAAAADVINALLVPVGPIIPQITAVEFLYGVIFGLFFAKAENNKAFYIRAALCGAVQFVISITLMSFILTSVGYFPSFRQAVIIRVVAAVALLAAHIGFMCALKRLVFLLKGYVKDELF